MPQNPDPIQTAAYACGAHIEASKVQAHEVPIIIAYLVIALSDLSRVPVPTVLNMVTTATRSIALEKRAKTAKRN